jgi:hypothetical protein
MAAALPPTALETDLLGQASADLRARARVVVGDVTERAADLAYGVTAAVTKEAEAQGLTAESLMQSASDAKRKSVMLSRSAPPPDPAALRTRQLGRAVIVTAQPPGPNRQLQNAAALVGVLYRLRAF